MPLPTMSLRRSSAASWKEMRKEEKSEGRGGTIGHRNPLPQEAEAELAVAELGGEVVGAERVLREEGKGRRR